jgi:hypothetical protein
MRSEKSTLLDAAIESCCLGRLLGDGREGAIDGKLDDGKKEAGDVVFELVPNTIGLDVAFEGMSRDMLEAPIDPDGGVSNGLVGGSIGMGDGISKGLLEGGCVYPISTVKI